MAKRLVLSVLGFILVPVLVRVIADEFTAWMPWITERLLRIAVRCLPKSQRRLRREEWKSHLNEFPGKLVKLIEALCLVPASISINLNANKGQRLLVLVRVFDITMGAFQLCAFVPLFLLIAILVRLDGAGPVFVREKRVGQFGRPFMMWRFRLGTRRVVSKSNDGEVRTKLRLSYIGRLLWWSRFSVTPQFVNVLCGDMTISGPRRLRSRSARDFKDVSPTPTSLEDKPSIFEPTNWRELWNHQGVA